MRIDQLPTYSPTAGDDLNATNGTFVSFSDLPQKIAVEDGMPKHACAEVCVYVGPKYWGLAYCDKGNWYSATSAENEEVFGVTHWSEILHW
jgi:hypothetical protein